MYLPIPPLLLLPCPPLKFLRLLGYAESLFCFCFWPFSFSTGPARNYGLYTEERRFIKKINKNLKPERKNIKWSKVPKKNYIEFAPIKICTYSLPGLRFFVPLIKVCLPNHGETLKNNISPRGSGHQPPPAPLHLRPLPAEDHGHLRVLFGLCLLGFHFLSERKVCVILQRWPLTSAAKKSWPTLCLHSCTVPEAGVPRDLHAVGPVLEFIQYRSDAVNTLVCWSDEHKNRCKRPRVFPCATAHA